MKTITHPVAADAHRVLASTAELAELGVLKLTVRELQHALRIPIAYINYTRLQWTADVDAGDSWLDGPDEVAAFDLTDPAHVRQFIADRRFMEKSA